jgi:hypothetical protein
LINHLIKNEKNDASMEKLVVFFIILISGCAFSNIEDGMNTLMGQPIDAAFNYLGYPDTEQIIANHHAYIWEHPRHQLS